jgi:hypothetical protein
VCAKCSLTRKHNQIERGTADTVAWNDIVVSRAWSDSLEKVIPMYIQSKADDDRMKISAARACLNSCRHKRKRMSARERPMHGFPMRHGVTR